MYKFSLHGNCIFHNIKNEMREEKLCFTCNKRLKNNNYEYDGYVFELENLCFWGKDFFILLLVYISRPHMIC